MKIINTYLDKYTFGNTPACIVLAQMLNEKNIDSAKISNLFNKFNKILNELSKINNEVAINLANLVYLKYTKNILNYPFHTYVHNVLKTNYKKWLKQQKEKHNNNNKIINNLN